MDTDISNHHHKCSILSLHRSKSSITTTNSQHLGGTTEVVASKPALRHCAVVSCAKKDASVALIAASVLKIAVKMG